jgi:hypothetical protein
MFGIGVTDAHGGVWRTVRCLLDVCAPYGIMYNCRRLCRNKFPVYHLLLPVALKSMRFTNLVSILDT